MALFAFSDSVNKLPLDILISRHQFLSHSALARDIRETPAAIVSQLTTVKARPLYVINIHADVYKGAGGVQLYGLVISGVIGECVHTTDGL